MITNDLYLNTRFSASNACVILNLIQNPGSLICFYLSPASRSLYPYGHSDTR